MNNAIEIKNLSKLYRLGLVGTGTLSHDLNRWWYNIRGKDDPYLKVGEVNKRSQKGDSNYIWALKSINLNIKRGEVLGIIGKNGAGKSTLLKILSRITGPTEGEIRYRGRIGSLLEIGTGFHQELTGRENIFLNGAILGMTKREIQSKFDEIVEFSGCSRYIDTPVKRYSSGMMVRLGFAVAAHLEPEILVVDEVLAVGDAEFQKRAVGKMKEVSQNDGRTILFVSHNMSSILSLCTQTLLLSDGSLASIGATEDIINEYLKSGNSYSGEMISTSPIKNNQKLKIEKVAILDESGTPHAELDLRKKVYIQFDFSVFIEGTGYNISFELVHLQHGVILTSGLYDSNPIFYSEKKWGKGQYNYQVFLPISILRGGEYYLNISASIPKREILDVFDGQISFHLLDTNSPAAKIAEGRRGSIMPILDWRSV